MLLTACNATFVLVSMLKSFRFAGKRSFIWNMESPVHGIMNISKILWLIFRELIISNSIENYAVHSVDCANDAFIYRAIFKA